MLKLLASYLYDTWASKTCPILNEFAALIMIAQYAYCKIQEHAAMVCLFQVDSSSGQWQEDMQAQLSSLS